MEIDEGQHSLKDFERVVAEGSSEKVEAYLDAMSPGDVALTLSRLSEEDKRRLLTTLSPEDAADLVEQVSEVQAVDLIESLHPKDAAAILDELPSDETADLLGDLGKEDAEAILAAMDPEEAREARTLSQYADDVAGGLMVTEYLSYPRAFSAAQVVEDLRLNAEKYRDYDVQYVYVTDHQGRLVGVLRLRELLLVRGGQAIEDLMITEPLRVSDTATLNELKGFFDRNPFFGVPVIDASGRLVGVVQRAATEEGLAERSDDDFRKSQGIVAGEEVRTMPLLLRVRRRLSWLTVNILLNVIAASVIALYQDTLVSVIALAAFLPIVSDMSGCSGNQAVAVSMRELALGFVRPTEMLRTWLREISVGAVNGLALGILIGGVAWLWKGNPFLGLVVGAAMALNTVVAVSIGGTIPLLLRRFKADPALASGPILTTITDACGFFLVLSFAAAMLPWLTAP